MGRLSKRDALLLEALFCALPLVYYLLRLPSMPETVPVHWNAAGEATRYAARFSFDTILSCFIGYMGLLLGRGLRAVFRDKSSENHAAVERIMAWNEALLCLLFTGMAFYFTYSLSASQEPGDGFILKLGAAVIALTLIAVGNQLPKLKRNPLSGARTRYSMSSDAAWYRTQRYAARVLLLCGAALLIITLLPVASPNASLISTAAALVIPVILIAAYRPK